MILLLSIMQNLMKKILNLIRKSDFDSKLKEISDRVTKNKTKRLLVENELKKLQTFDVAYFRGKSHSEEHMAHKNI